MESCGNSITGVSDSLGMESTVAGKRVEGTRRCGEAREGLRYSRLRCLNVGVPGGEGEDGSGGRRAAERWEQWERVPSQFVILAATFG